MAICNHVGDNQAGRNFPGVTFVCNAVGEVIAKGKTGDEEEMVIADLSSTKLTEHRRTAETFFRHFRRPELYDSWRREAGRG